MPMTSEDLTQRRAEIGAKMQEAIKNNDADAFSAQMEAMMQNIADDVEMQAARRIDGIRQDLDTTVLANRGVRQLTTEEKKYYQKLAAAMWDANPKMALANLEEVLPKTVIDAVFDELQTRHPLLRRIDFIPVNAVTEIVMNTNEYQEAVWGELCDEIIKEVTSGFKVVNMSLLKLSAFISVCKAMLEIGPEWLDNYIRQVLYEVLANGLEAGIVAGNGNKMPIGMNRQVGDNVTTTGGVYPLKEKIIVNDFSPATVGNLLSLIAMDPNGKPRVPRDLILLVNPADYYQKVMPATTLMAPDGTYRNDVMPYPMEIIQTPALARGEAILGIGYKYFAGAGMERGGRIEYSDHYQFLEDKRTYIIKLYANGFPMDNNAFLFLDISGLQPATWKVTAVDAPTPGSNANLSDLKIGSLTLSPAFAADTTTYTATTSNATNTINAMPADASAAIAITVNDTAIDNGTAATWTSGANTVKVVVTAQDGTTTKTYTVTVTAE